MAVSVKDVQKQTERILNKISILPDMSGQRAALAELRRGIGKKPGEIPMLWGMLLEDMPEEMMTGNNSVQDVLEPTRAEWAVYLAITLYALHQQGMSVKTQCMNTPGRGIGTAVALLVKDVNEQERILRRFNIMATSSDITELSHHLRGIIQLLRSEGIGLDYPRLSGDLYSYQFPDRVSNIRLTWGEDFYKEQHMKEKEENQDE